MNKIKGYCIILMLFHLQILRPNPLGYFDLGCVEKSHSPAGTLNTMYENMDKKPINMDKNNKIWTQTWTYIYYICVWYYMMIGCRGYTCKDSWSQLWVDQTLAMKDSTTHVSLCYHCKYKSAPKDPNRPTRNRERTPRGTILVTILVTESLANSDEGVGTATPPPTNNI